MKKFTLLALLALSALLLTLFANLEKEEVLPQDIIPAEQGTDTQSPDCSNPIQIYEDPSRLPLRRFVLEKMGDLSGKTIVDIGAGPGFFAFEMAKRAERVITTELDPLFLDYMREKADRQGVANLEVRTADAVQSEFQNLQADYALMVYVFHYLDDPKEFLARLKPVLQPGGKLFIANAQLSPVIIKDYLKGAGFTDLSEASFVMESTGCGPQTVQLISGTAPGADLAGR